MADIISDGKCKLISNFKKELITRQVAGESVIFKKPLDRKGREGDASYTHRTELSIPCCSLLEGSPQHGQMVTNFSLKLQYWRQVQSASKPV